MTRTQLRTRHTECTAHLATATRLGDSALVSLYTRELARIEAKMGPVQPKAPKVRCPHYKLIRSFFAAATERKLDTKNDSAIRRAFEDFFIRPIRSREELTAADWMAAKEAVSHGNLYW